MPVLFKGNLPHRFPKARQIRRNAFYSDNLNADERSTECSWFLQRTKSCRLINCSGFFKP